MFTTFTKQILSDRLLLAISLLLENKNKNLCLNVFVKNISVCFDVKYFLENIFTFYNVCFVVKYLVKSKIFLVNQINLGIV